MIEVLPTGLTRITCDRCGAKYETAFEATEPHQKHFDPVEEIGWTSVSSETLCPDCTNQNERTKTMNGTSETTEGTKLHPVKIIKRTKNLGTPLSNNEKAERGELVAHLVQKIVEKKEARKNAGAQLKAEIDELDAELKKVSLEISCGMVFRDVQILEKHIYQTGTYQEVRVDTNKVIFERALTEKERQLELGVDGESTNGEADDEPGAREDEEPEASAAAENDPVYQNGLEGPEPELETAKSGRGRGGGGGRKRTKNGKGRGRGARA